MITVQQGKTVTIALEFKNADGTVAAPPTSGGSVNNNTGHGYGTVSLAADQVTVTYTANIITPVGQYDIITYSGPQGLTATENVTIVATTATTVVFNEATLTLKP